jgi:hypothetical protein
MWGWTAYFVVLSTLVGIQVVSTWRYGWKGLAASTGAELVLSASALALSYFWLDAQDAGQLPDVLRTEKAVAGVFLFLIPSLTVLVTALLSSVFALFSSAFVEKE